MSDFVGTAGDDILVGTSGNDVMNGGAGKDRLNGGDGDDIINGGDGNDYVYGDAGNDTLYGGTGNDTLVGDAGDDVIYGEDGNDGVFGGGGNDIIFGGNGVDTIYGDGGNDFIDGGNDNDKLYGGSGNDTLFGGMGDDILDGGAGNDTLIYESGTGSDVLVGGLGIDTVELKVAEADLADLTGDLADFADWLDAQYAAAGGDVNVLAGQAASGSFTFASLGLTVSSIEKLDLYVDGTGVDWRNLLHVNAAPVAAAEQSITVDEDHSVSGMVGATDADGDAMAHEISSGPANGTVTINQLTGEFVYTPAENFSGADSFEVTITDANGASVKQVVNVTVNGVADTPTVSASNVMVSIGGAVIEGTGGNDVLHGTAGSDVIIGGAGDDILYSESAGADGYTQELHIQAALGDLDGSENLMVEIAGVPAGAVLSAGREVSPGVWMVGAGDLAGLKLSIGSPSNFSLSVTAIATEQNGSTSSSCCTVEVCCEGADGTGGVDILRGGAGNDQMYGGAGFDFIDYSTTGNGVHVSMSAGIAEGDGHDTFKGIEGVIGSAFSDEIIGDSGDNVIMAGAGKDAVDGGAGNDTIYDGTGADKIDGGSGNDVIVAAADGDSDKFSGGSGFDIVDYSEAKTSIKVDLNNGQVSGAVGNDKLYDIEGVIGGSGDDQLLGSKGDDHLNGGAGNDVIHGGRGYDVLTGGEGSDTFVFERGDVLTGSNYYGFDTITDFGAGDKLDFSDFGSKKSAFDVLHEVHLTENMEGTMISLDFGGHSGYVDVVFLEGVHGIDIHDLISGGHFVV
ncbi:MAG: Ig-like domain-containing protein [Hyphomicrobiaceae bacterium]